MGMKLLDLPAYRRLLSDCGSRSCRKIVGDDPFRVFGRGNQLEQFDLMALGKFLEVNEFATLLFALIEGQSIQSSVGHFRALHCLSIPLERAIVDLVGPLDRFDHLHAGVP